MTDIDKAGRAVNAVGSFVGSAGATLKLIESTIGGADAAAKLPGPLGVIGGIVGGLLEAFNAASRELDALIKDMQANPTVDGSASDAVAADLAADMSDGEG